MKSVEVFFPSMWHLSQEALFCVPADVDSTFKNDLDIKALRSLCLSKCSVASLVIIFDMC